MTPPAPATHWSFVVQALPSSQLAPACSGLPTHAPVSLHLSFLVQSLPSSQGVPRPRAWPEHAPAPSQASFCVQELPSSHAVPASRGTCRQPPVCGSVEQLSAVQGLASSQLSASCLHVPVVASH